ncbi:hypothetical protein J4E90_006325 [Alternaria incomplexa]|uniref:uncharacterized protein n=1 Tax=Alternaria incomplexa TaxID=1187928 RepID=UPI002220C182|nr:uncharacterized protein J4E90_006325 [Alternaria incomplexa]KAI4912917.1 hypothetical protein J4E90_006325 [Alternaria incomplexa]
MLTEPAVQPVDKETDDSAGRSIKQEPVDGSTDRTEEQRLESERPETSFERAFRLQQAKEESARKRMRY